MKIVNIRVEIADFMLDEIVSEIELSGADKNYMYLVEVYGNPVVYYSNEDMFNKLIDDESSDEFEKILGDTRIDSYKGIDLTDYDTIVNTIDEANDEEAKKLIKLLVAVTRSDIEETNKTIANCIGKEINDITPPEIETEEEY